MDRTYVRSRTLTIAVLTALIAEAAIGSSGRWLAVGPVSIRILLLAVCLLVGLPLVWRERRHVLHSSMVWVTALFLLTLVVSAVWAHHLGNRTGFIVNDLTTFSALLLVPVVVALRLGAGEVNRLVTVLFVAASGLAAITFAIHVLIAVGALDPTATAIWLTDRSLGGVADVGGGMYRIYFRSQIMFIPALVIGLQRIATATDKRQRALWVVGSSILAIGLVVSLSRSLWIGFALSLAVLLVWCVRNLPAILRAGAMVAVGTAALVLVSMAVNQGPALVTAAVQRLNPSLVVVVNGADGPDGPDGDKTGGRVDPELSEVDAESVALRGETLQLTREAISERPVVGSGIGYNLDSIRDDGRTEYMYWDLLMKLGILGTAVFLLSYLWPAFGILRRGGPFATLSDPRVLAAGLAGVAAASYFNPFLNSTLGIVILLLLVAAAAVRDDETTDHLEAEVVDAADETRPGRGLEDTGSRRSASTAPE